MDKWKNKVTNLQHLQHNKCKGLCQWEKGKGDRRLQTGDRTKGKKCCKIVTLISTSKYIKYCQSLCKYEIYAFFRVAYKIHPPAYSFLRAGVTGAASRVCNHLKGPRRGNCLNNDLWENTNCTNLGRIARSENSLNCDFYDFYDLELWII